MIRDCFKRVLTATALTLVTVTGAFAQDEDDAVLRLAQPEFALVSLPTSLRVPTFKSAFRVTHRFTRPLDCDACANSLFADLFGVDGGALIGLEYRFGIFPNAQLGIHRTSDKTIELFAQYGLARQGGGSPIEASALFAVDFSDVGRRNADTHTSPALGVIITRLVGDRAAFYIEPIWVRNSNLFQTSVDEDNTVILGLGTRIRVSSGVYLVGEFAPRVAGYKPNSHHGSFAIEKRAGGHMFQLNFSTTFATTLSHLARGSSSGDTQWHMGFNIARKFF